MLEMERTPDSESNVRYGRNTQNPLDENVVIVDEASMMDIFLTEALMRAMRRGARLILIGDADQLPSVGAGNVFYDLISSGRIRTVRLTEIFRQSRESLIITNAHKINHGEDPVLNVTDNDFFFVNSYENRIPSTVATLVMQRLPRAYGESIKDGIQVITPSKKGFGGVEALNAELQSRLNPQSSLKKEKTSHGTVFREGDKVMQTANNYELEWEKGGFVGAGIFNGDIGCIESIDNSKSMMVINFDGKTVKYDFELLDDLELAYAITVHKSQGSEYPVVILPMYNCPPMLLTRNLLYTAITRAKRMVILVGRADIPHRMVENNREILRYTTLKEQICRYISQ
jgi:exodeoxyribonuclease V alpha subunit